MEGGWPKGSGPACVGQVPKGEWHCDSTHPMPLTPRALLGRQDLVSRTMEGKLKPDEYSSGARLCVPRKTGGRAGRIGHSIPKA
eukprot:scaffold2974_cov119-Isochrysis_galbana.AAC.2